MEKIIEVHVSDFCKKNNFEYIAQANAKKIKNKWGFIVQVNKSSRSFDFAIFNPKTSKIKLIETNFFNGGGSKPKAVCGEFKSLYRELKEQNIDFIWITDGHGWKSSHKSLQETFENNDYVFNIAMMENGILEKLNW